MALSESRILPSIGGVQYSETLTQPGQWTKNSPKLTTLPSHILLPLIPLLLIFTPLQTNAQSTSPRTIRFAPQWGTPRRWIGPSWWAQPLYDWKVDRENKVTTPAARNRTLSLLTYEVSKTGSTLNLSVSIFFNRPSSKTITRVPASVAAGFSLGRVGFINDFRSAAVRPKRDVRVFLRGDGALDVAGKISDDKDSLTIRAGDEIHFSISCVRVVNKIVFSVMAKRLEDGSIVTMTRKLPMFYIPGAIALMSYGSQFGYVAQSTVTVSFSNLIIEGNMLQRFKFRAFGPVLWSQYTLSKGKVRLQAQLAPLEGKTLVKLHIGDMGGARALKLVKNALMRRDSRTALFEIDGWDSSKEKVYAVRVKWQGVTHEWRGVIRAEPTEKRAGNELRLACFSCDEGYLFPLPSMVYQVRRQNPDMVFFAGDQIYESVGDFPTLRNEKMDVLILEFLRKVYLFGWTWRTVLRDRPSVIIPDDHDVFQGNLWGASGRVLPRRRKKVWARGGYYMPGEWVRVVERVFTGHLPKSVANITLPIGVSTYFTEMLYGGVSFAILEDRKFKTGPLSLGVRGRKTGVGGELLGPVQEAFVKRWVRRDLEEGIFMRVALSQTLWAKGSTHAGWSMKRIRFVDDSGGWPREARDRVVELLGEGRVFSIHGDQHVGMVVRHGVRTFGDCGYSMMVPGTANGFPRAWWPGVGDGGISEVRRKKWKFTGRFYDDAGIPMDVLAVANPNVESVLKEGWKAMNAEEVGYEKGSGYGLLVFEKGKRLVTVNMFRLGYIGEQFDGFPVIIDVDAPPDGSTETTGGRGADAREKEGERGPSS